MGDGPIARARCGCFDFGEKQKVDYIDKVFSALCE